jgi:hypothetical protein
VGCICELAPSSSPSARRDTADKQSPEASAIVSAVKKACEGSEAWKWGGGMDMSAMLGPGVTKVNAIENVM